MKEVISKMNCRPLVANTHSLLGGCLWVVVDEAMSYTRLALIIGYLIEVQALTRVVTFPVVEVIKEVCYTN